MNAIIVTLYHSKVLQWHCAKKQEAQLSRRDRATLLVIVGHV